MDPVCAPWVSKDPEKAGSALTFQILRDTGVFEHTWQELDLWLEHLDDTAEENKEAVIQFLERVSRCFPCKGTHSGRPARSRCGATASGSGVAAAVA